MILDGLRNDGTITTEPVYGVPTSPYARYATILCDGRAIGYIIDQCYGQDRPEDRFTATTHLKVVKRGSGTPAEMRRCYSYEQAVEHLIAEARKPSEVR